MYTIYKPTCSLPTDLILKDYKHIWKLTNRSKRIIIKNDSPNKGYVDYFRKIQELKHIEKT